MHLGTIRSSFAPAPAPGGGTRNTSSSTVAPNASCRFSSTSSSAATSTIRRMQSSRNLRSWWKRMTPHTHRLRPQASASFSALASSSSRAASSSSRSSSSATLSVSSTNSALISYGSPPLPSSLGIVILPVLEGGVGVSDGCRDERRCMSLPGTNLVLLSLFRAFLSRKRRNARWFSASSVSSVARPSKRCWHTASSSPWSAWSASRGRRSDMVLGSVRRLAVTRFVGRKERREKKGQTRGDGCLFSQRMSFFFCGSRFVSMVRNWLACWGYC